MLKKLLEFILMTTVLSYFYIIVFNGDFRAYIQTFTGGDWDASMIWWILIIIGGTPIYLERISNYSSWFNFLKPVVYITAIPYAIVQLLVPLVDLTMATVLSLVVIAIACHIEIRFIKFCGIEVNTPAEFYLWTTSFTILTHLFLVKLNRVFLRFNSTSEEKKKTYYQKQKLMDQWISKDRISVVFYTLFFLTLVIYNFITIILKINYNVEEDIGKALIASVATYVAFEKIPANWHRFQFNTRKFFKGYFKLIMDKYDIPKTKKEYPKF